MVQVYLNGNLVELSSQEFALNISNSALSNLSQRATTHTNSFRLPKSTKNLRLLSNVGLLGTKNEITNSNIPAKIVNAGITVLEHGIANIVGIDSEYIEIEIYSSVRRLGDILSQKKLIDLSYPATSHELNITQIINANRRPDSAFIYANINLQAEGGGDEPFVPYMLPCIRERWLLDQIFEQNGFKYTGEVPNEDVVIGPSRGLDINIGEKPPPRAIESEIVGIDGDVFGGLTRAIPRLPQDAVLPTSNISDFSFNYDTALSPEVSLEAPDIINNDPDIQLSPNTIFISLGSVDIVRPGSLIVTTKDDSQLQINEKTPSREAGRFNEGDNSSISGVRTNLIVLKSGDNEVGYWFFEPGKRAPYILGNADAGYSVEFYSVLQLYYSHFVSTAGFDVVPIVKNIQSSANTKIEFTVIYAPSAGSPFTDRRQFWYDITISGELDASYIELDPLPRVELEDIVPDISQLDFVKEILWRYGLLLSPTEDNDTYSLEFIDRIVKSGVGTIDWSSKYLGFEEKIYDTEFGQENLFSYKEYPEYSRFADGKFEISSGLADPIKQVISSKYEFREKEARRFRLGIYGDISNGFPRKNKLAPNIFRLNSLDLVEVKIDDFNTIRLDLWDLTHNYLAWNQMTLLYYDGLRQVAEVNETIRANFRLNAGDIKDLDLYKTVYVEQLGAKFYISRIENYTSDAPTTIVELAKLPNTFTDIPDIPLLNESTGISAIISDCILQVAIQPANIVSAASNSLHTINFQVTTQENIRYYLYGVYFTGQSVLSAELNATTGTGLIRVRCSVNNTAIAEINTLQLIVYDTRGNCGKAGITFRVAEDLSSTETEWIGKDNKTLWRADDDITIHGGHTGTLTSSQLVVSFNNPPGVNVSGNPVVQKTIDGNSWRIRFTNSFTPENPSFNRSFSQIVNISIRGTRLPFTLWQLLTNIPAINRVGFQWLDEDKLPINLNAWITANAVPEDETHLLSTAGVLEIGGGVPPYNIEVTNIPAEFDAIYQLGRLTTTYLQLMDLGKQSDSKVTFPAYEEIIVRKETDQPTEIVDLLQRPLNTTFARAVAIYTMPEIGIRQAQNRRLTLKLTDNSPEPIVLQRSINYRYRDGIPEPITLLPEVDLGFDCGGLDFGENYRVFFMINLPTGDVTRTDVERVDLTRFGLGANRIVIRLYEAQHTSQLYGIAWTIPRGQVPYNLKVELCAIQVTNDTVCIDPRFQTSPLVIISSDITPDPTDRNRDVVNVFFQTKIEYQTNTIDRYWQQCIRITLQDSCYITNKKVLDVPIFIEHQPRPSAGCSPIVVEEELSDGTFRALDADNGINFGYSSGSASSKIIVIKTGGVFQSDILCNEDNIFRKQSGGERLTRGNPNTRERLVIVADDIPARKNPQGLPVVRSAVVHIFSDCWHEKIPITANELTDGTACFTIPDLAIGDGDLCNSLDPVPVYSGTEHQLDRSVATSHVFNVSIRPNNITTFPYHISVTGGYNDGSTLERIRGGAGNTGLARIDNANTGRIRIPENEDNNNNAVTIVNLNYRDSNTTNRNIPLRIVQPPSNQPACGVRIEPATPPNVERVGRTFTVRLTPFRPTNTVTFSKRTSPSTPWAVLTNLGGNQWQIRIAPNPTGSTRRVVFDYAVSCTNETFEYVVTQKGGTPGNFSIRFNRYTGGTSVAPEDPCTIDRTIGGTPRAPRFNFPLATFSMPSRTEISGATTVTERIGYDLTCPATIAELRADQQIVRTRENAIRLTLDFGGQTAWGSARLDVVSREVILEFNENRTTTSRTATLTGEFTARTDVSRDSIQIIQGTSEKPECKIVAQGVGAVGASSPILPKEAGGVAEFKYTITNALGATASILTGYPDWFTDVDHDTGTNTIRVTIDRNTDFSPDGRSGGFILRVQNQLGFSDCIGTVRQAPRPPLSNPGLICLDELNNRIPCENPIIIKAQVGSSATRRTNLLNGLFFEDLGVSVNVTWASVELAKGTGEVGDPPTDMEIVRVIATSTELNFNRANRSGSITIFDKNETSRIFQRIPLTQLFDDTIDDYSIEFYDQNGKPLGVGGRNIGPVSFTGAEDVTIRFAIGVENDAGTLQGQTNTNNLRILDNQGWINPGAPTDSGLTVSTSNLTPAIPSGTTIFQTLVDITPSSITSERSGVVRFEVLSAQGLIATPNARITITQSGKPADLAFNIPQGSVSVDATDTFVVVPYTMNKGNEDSLSYGYNNQNRVVSAATATYSVNEGTGNLTFTLVPNTTTNPRSETVRVTATVGSESAVDSIVINQRAGTGRVPPQITFNSSDLAGLSEFSVDGGSQTVRYTISNGVIADVRFTTSSWIRYGTDPTGNDPAAATGVLTITASPQPSGNQSRRTGQLRASPRNTGGTGATKVITLSQAPRGEPCPAPTISQTSNNSPVLADGTETAEIGIRVSNFDNNRAPIGNETDRRVYITDVNSRVEDNEGNLMGTSAFPVPPWFRSAPVVNPVPASQSDKSVSTIGVLVRANTGAQRSVTFYVRVTTECGDARLQVAVTQLGVPDAPCNISFNNTANREISSPGGEIRELIQVSGQGNTSVLSASFVDLATSRAATWVSGTFPTDDQGLQLAVATVAANDTGSQRKATWSIRTTNTRGIACIATKNITQLAETRTAPTIALTPEEIDLDAWNQPDQTNTIRYAITNAVPLDVTFSIESAQITLADGRTIDGPTIEVATNNRTTRVLTVNSIGFNYGFSEFDLGVTGTVATSDGTDSDITQITWPARPNYLERPQITTRPFRIDLDNENTSRGLTITLVNALMADVTFDTSKLHNNISVGDITDLNGTTETVDVFVGPDLQVPIGQYVLRIVATNNLGEASFEVGVDIDEAIDTRVRMLFSPNLRSEDFNISKWNLGTTFEDITAQLVLSGIDINDINIAYAGLGAKYDANGYLIEDTRLIDDNISAVAKTIRFRARGNNYRYGTNSITKTATLTNSKAPDIVGNFIWPARDNYSADPTISITNTDGFQSRAGKSFNISVGNAVLGDVYIEFTGSTPANLDFTAGMDFANDKYYLGESDRIESSADIYMTFNSEGTYNFTARVRNNRRAVSTNFRFVVAGDPILINFTPTSITLTTWDKILPSEIDLEYNATRPGIRSDIISEDDRRERSLILESDGNYSFGNLTRADIEVAADRTPVETTTGIIDLPNKTIRHNDFTFLATTLHFWVILRNRLSVVVRNFFRPETQNIAVFGNDNSNFFNKNLSFGKNKIYELTLRGSSVSERGENDATTVSSDINSNVLRLIQPPRPGYTAVPAVNLSANSISNSDLPFTLTVTIGNGLVADITSIDQSNISPGTLTFTANEDTITETSGTIVISSDNPRASGHIIFTATNNIGSATARLTISDATILLAVAFDSDTLDVGNDGKIVNIPYTLRRGLNSNVNITTGTGQVINTATRGVFNVSAQRGIVSVDTNVHTGSFERSQTLTLTVVGADEPNTATITLIQPALTTRFQLADGSKSTTFNLSKWDPGTTVQNFLASFDLNGLTITDITIAYDEDNDVETYNNQGYLTDDVQVATGTKSNTDQTIQFRCDGSNFSFASALTILVECSYESQTDISLRFRWPQRPNYTAAPTIVGSAPAAIGKNAITNIRTTVTNAVLGDVKFDLTAGDATKFTFGGETQGSNYYMGRSKRVSTAENESVLFTETGSYTLRAQVTNNIGTATYLYRLNVTEPPDPVTNLRAEVGNGQVTLRWTEGARATGHMVSYTRSTTIADDATGVTSGNERTQWIDILGIGSTEIARVADLDNGFEYRFRVRCTNAVGQSTWSFIKATPVAPTRAFIYDDNTRSRNFNLSKWDQGTTWQNFPQGINRTGVADNDITADLGNINNDLVTSNRLQTDGELNIDYPNKRFRIQGNNYRAVAITKTITLTVSGFQPLRAHFIWPARPEYTEAPTISVAAGGGGQATTSGITNFSIVVNNAVLGDVRILKRAGPNDFTPGLTRSGSNFFIERADRHKTSATVSMQFGARGSYIFTANVVTNRGSRTGTFSFSVT